MAWQALAASAKKEVPCLLADPGVKTNGCDELPERFELFLVRKKHQFHHTKEIHQNGLRMANQVEEPRNHSGNSPSTKSGECNQL